MQHLKPCRGVETAISARDNDILVALYALALFVAVGHIRICQRGQCEEEKKAHFGPCEREVKTVRKIISK